MPRLTLADNRRAALEIERNELMDVLARLHRETEALYAAAANAESPAAAKKLRRKALATERNRRYTEIKYTDRRISRDRRCTA